MCGTASGGRRYSRQREPTALVRSLDAMRMLDPQSLPQHVDRLFRAAWALCGSREDAEDLVQETFARVLARPRVLHGDEELYYLMRVLRNTFLTTRRTASRRPVTAATLEDVVAADSRPTGQPQAGARGAGAVRHDRRAAGGLPPGARRRRRARAVLPRGRSRAARARGDDHDAAVPRPKPGRPSARGAGGRAAPGRAQSGSSVQRGRLRGGTPDASARARAARARAATTRGERSRLADDEAGKESGAGGVYQGGANQ